MNFRTYTINILNPLFVSTPSCKTPAPKSTLIIIYKISSAVSLAYIQSSTSKFAGDNGLATSFKYHEVLNVSDPM